MKKVSLILMAALLALTMTGCKKKVVLQCDGRDCQNAVRFRVEQDVNPDESWVALCKDCAAHVVVK